MYIEMSNLVFGQSCFFSTFKEAFRVFDWLELTLVKLIFLLAHFKARAASLESSILTANSFDVHN
jgi:hypothetical protein